VPATLAQIPMWRMILDATIFGVTGIALLIVGYYIWELVTPYNLRRELQENKNLAVAVVAASFIVGMAIVVAAALVHIGRH
jgi:putative membrane protein